MKSYNSRKKKIMVILFLSIIMFSVSIWQYIVLNRKDDKTSEEKRLKNMWESFMYIFGVTSFLLFIILINLKLDNIFDNVKIIDIDGNVINRKTQYNKGLNDNVEKNIYNTTSLNY